MLKIKLLSAICCLAGLVACGDDGGSVVDAPKAPSDAAIDAPTTTPDADCFTNPDPNSHIQIINACTTAQKIYKDSNPPLQNPDGSLPPLP